MVLYTVISANEVARVKEDLEKYCALDTYAVVKVLKKLYDVTR